MTTPITMPTSETTTHTRSVARSIWAVFAGFLAVFVLSLGTDEVLHRLQVYPPWNEPMWDPRLNALALSYRLVFNTAGSYITARLAPQAPMRHVWIGASIGFVLSLAGAIAGIKLELGPAWYPLALAFSAWPCAWLAGALYRRTTQAAR
jgi:hypothetical protein